ncbi:phage tail sheath family protein [Serratia sp. NPDC078593]|uniref:phage tail sheath family protein n=1 Tax=unclassified Serratia (in: enterobacteria) TaxID=2647522 RepID=UPI0037D639D4
MPTVTSVPGVYIEEDASPAISVSQGATAVPLFVAHFTPLKAEQKGVITRISSWLDYSTLFDATTAFSAKATLTSTPVEPTPDPDPETKSRLAAESELSDGVKKQTQDAAAEAKQEYTYTIDSVEVLPPTASLAIQLYFQNGGGPCYLYPLEKHDDAAQLNALPGLIDEVGEITLLACPETDEAYRTAVYGALLASLDQNKGYFLLADSSKGDKPTGLSSSAHVAVYYPELVSVSHVTKLDDERVAVIGYVDEAGTKVATLIDLRAVNASLAKDITQQLDSKRPAQLLIPPSPIMAGVYCKTDRERGVWKAPANVVLNGISDVSVRVTNDQQATMNQVGINVIRDFSDRGLVVWGARTLQDDDNWRYIPVRRLFDMAQRDIKKALRPMVFEPNSQPTWKRVQAAIENYLYSLWQRGGLAGNKAEEAYSVRIGKGITMTQDDINQGKMIIQVGMAAVRPAEFIILQFTQDMAQ